MANISVTHPFVSGKSDGPDATLVQPSNWNAAHTLVFNTSLGGMRNKIINGDFNIWQRGTSFTAVASGTYTADRWGYTKSSAAVHTISKSADAPSVAQAGTFSDSCILVDCTTVDSSIASGDYVLAYQAIEGNNFRILAQRSFTLNFWHKHTKTGTYCVSFRNSGADRSYVAEYTQASPDTWEKATITVAASPSAGTWDYANGVGLYIGFVVLCGSTTQTTPNSWNTGNFLATSNQVNGCDNTANNFRLALVQVEPGDEATPFEARAYGQEVALCQRYFNKSYSLATVPGTVTSAGQIVSNTTNGGNNAYLTIRYPVAMRTTPTITLYSTNSGVTGKWMNQSGTDLTTTANDANEYNFWVNVAGLSSATAVSGHYTAAAEF